MHCTLKHFPGLGGVFEDTHVEAGHLRAPLAALERSDWIPFRALMGGQHVHHVEPRPARCARCGAAGFVLGRRRLGLLRNDGAMTAYSSPTISAWDAVYASREGIATASVAALDAGVDLILISYDPAQYFTMMDAVSRRRATGGCAMTFLGVAQGGWLVQGWGVNCLNFLHLCHRPAHQYGCVRAAPRRAQPRIHEASTNRAVHLVRGAVLRVRGVPPARITRPRG